MRTSRTISTKNFVVAWYHEQTIQVHEFLFLFYFIPSLYSFLPVMYLFCYEYILMVWYEAKNIPLYLLLFFPLHSSLVFSLFPQNRPHVLFPLSKFPRDNIALKLSSFILFFYLLFFPLRLFFLPFPFLRTDRNVSFPHTKADLFTRTSLNSAVNDFWISFLRSSHVDLFLTCNGDTFLRGFPPSHSSLVTVLTYGCDGENFSPLLNISSAESAYGPF